MKTYNQVIKVLSDIAGAHQQVETFGEGDVWDIAENTAYPLMYVTPQPGSLNIERSETSLSLAIIFADLAKEDKSNEAEVRSDMQQVAFDVLAQLQLPDYVDLFTVVPSARLTPFSDAHPDRVTGWVLELTLRMDYLSDWCIVPSTLTPGTVLGCPTVKVYDSAGTLLATVAAGGTYTVTDTTVKNSAGTTIGTGVAQSIITVADKTLTNSDATFSSPIVQGVNKVLADISVTDYLGAVTTYPAAKDITISVPARTYAYPPPTGQVISYRTGDDPNIQTTKFNALTRGYIIPLASFLVLAENNVFGNTNRLTDDLGGQTYTSGVVIDNHSGLMWGKALNTGGEVTWENAIDGALADFAGYSGWFLPTRNQLVSILKLNVSPCINYAPFSIASTGYRIWTSTTHINAAGSQAWYLDIPNNFGTDTDIIRSENKPNPQRYMRCRKHF